MLKKCLIYMVLLCLPFTSINCAYLMGYRHTEIPSVDLPKEVQKPGIKAVTIQQNGKWYVAYTTEDALLLYKYEMAQDAYTDKLIFRIDQMNKLLKGLNK